ncbi:2-phospho-L-lactate transferase CofD family protein [uncultured Paludibaculum sp.]|uniref:2-phospho-L-lactate transferase CofD family protein n=1 Tax=uncultured Paludibaculum sp. TaxID=1765020 RepID=UPI002AAC1B1D|nr:2-phospho-L-lactate transferase CofD family protein [uncultured Paludibaculum sp.]
MTTRNPVNVCIFCGGRGSAALIRELLRRPDIQLSLLVNAYDDGLSTGALREFIPGMLGPSDFRKNLSYILDFYSPQQFGLLRLFEYRLPEGFDQNGAEGFKQYVKTGDDRTLDVQLRSLFGDLEARTRQQALRMLRAFFKYHAASDARQKLTFNDCSLGNLLFAGSHILCGGDFNAATAMLSELVGSKARLINVSEGECRTLVGLKADGTLLGCEGQLVGKQSPVPIIDTFLLGSTPEPAEWQEVANTSVDEKALWLRSRELPVKPSEEALAALAAADVILYGAGTQHSSVLPSCRIAREAILSSPARIKAQVINLREDHDIQGLSVTDLVDRALFYLDDPSNARRGITHFLYNASGESCNAIRLDPSRLDSGEKYKGATAVGGSFENYVKPNVHNGYAVVDQLLQLLRSAGREAAEGLDIYLDLVGRNLALESIIDELAELPVHDRVGPVSVFLSGAKVPSGWTNSRVLFHESAFEGPNAEVSFLREWLSKRSSEYLVTMTGDGEYRLGDIVPAVEVLRAANYGAVLGSRLQSRLQFRTSLRAAYGESGLLFHLSAIGAFLTSAVFGLRFSVFISDPLTGFRVYRRNQLSAEFQKALSERSSDTAIGVMQRLLECNVEIAEIPVVYRTFTGFTDAKWRFRRGLRNLFRALS